MPLEAVLLFGKESAKLSKKYFIAQEHNKKHLIMD